MNRILLVFVATFAVCFPARAVLLINDADCSSGSYTYGLSFTDMQNSTKFYNDVYSYSNVAVVQDGTGSSQRNYVCAQAATPSASIIYEFDFTNTKYRPTAISVMDDLYDGEASPNASTITTDYATNLSGPWTTISTVSTPSNLGGGTLYHATLSSPTTVFYRVTYTATTGNFIGNLNQWNRMASGAGAPFGITFTLGTITIPPVTITPTDPTTVENGILAAYKNGASSVTIPAGTYNLSADPSQTNYHLYFNGLKNFTINCSGTVILNFTNRTSRTMTLTNCSNVTFNGNGTTTFARSTIPTSQGTISAISGQVVSILLDAGYPGYSNINDLINDSPYFIGTGVFSDIDGTTQRPKPGVPIIYMTTHKTGNNTYVSWSNPSSHTVQVTCKTSLSGVPLAVGDHVAWRGTVLYDIDLRLSDHMTMENFTMKGGAGFVFFEGGTGANTYTNITETYPDTPSGATQIPLLSSCADGFHSDGCRIGPTVTNCSFVGTDDDGMSVHGNYGLVTDTASGNMIIADCPATIGTLPFCQIGDTVNLYDTYGAYAGQTSVTGITELTSYTPPAGFPPSSYQYFISSLPNARYYQITLATAISAQENWAIANKSQIGTGFSFTGCSVINCMNHPMLIKASGTIQGCMLSYDGGGLTVEPEVGGWGESDYAAGLTIDGNTFTDIGINRQCQTAAVSIDGFEINPAYGSYQYVPINGTTAGHQNITVSNNVFKGNDAINLLVSTAQNVTISNNNFFVPMVNVIPFYGHSSGSDQNSLIWLTNDKNVSFSGNFAADVGPQMTDGMVVSTSTVTGTTGLPGGIVQGHEIAAFFDSGNSSTTPDAYPGDAGGHWLTAWTWSSNLATGSATTSTTTPLFSDSVNYAQTTIATTASTASSAALYREYDSSIVDVTQPHQIAFDYRPEAVDGNARLPIFGRAGSASANTDGNDTWMIIGTTAGWSLYNGTTGSTVASGVPLVVGRSYHFNIVVTPGTAGARGTWVATITDGIDTPYTSPTLGFRINASSDGPYIEFCSSNNTAATAATYGFSVDSVLVANQVTGALAFNTPLQEGSGKFVRQDSNGKLGTLKLTLVTDLKSAQGSLSLNLDSGLAPF